LKTSLSSLSSGDCPQVIIGNDFAFAYRMDAYTNTVFRQQTHRLTEVFRAARNGDHNAFTALVSPHTPRLRRLARRFTRNAQDAEDVCQESLLKAFTKLHYFGDSEGIARGEFCSWLSRITANSAIDFLRRKQDVVSLEEYDPADTVSARGGWGENPEACYARQERLRLVMDALGKLAPELRRVCILRDLMELSTKEVASRLRLPAVTVRVRLFRAHSELRRILDLVGRARGEARRENRKRMTADEQRSRNRRSVEVQFESAAAFACGG